LRCAIALIWLHEGLWKKIVTGNAYELSIVRQFSATPEGARQLMNVIGAAETLLALGVLSGLFARPLAWFQIAILLAMNLTGIFFGGGTIREPVVLLIHNLPLLLCMAIIGLHGPGAFALNGKNRDVQ